MPNLLTLLLHLLQVMVAQANFVRVRVKAVEGAAAGSTPPQRELLCVCAYLTPSRQSLVVPYNEQTFMFKFVLPRQPDIQHYAAQVCRAVAAEEDQAAGARWRRRPGHQRRLDGRQRWV